jgi:hypothetical protein
MGANPAGEIYRQMGVVFDDLRAEHHDYAGVRERMLWLVQVAEVKALRDRNLRHFANCFDPTDAKFGLQVTDLAALAAQTPSRMATGPAEVKRQEALARERPGPRKQPAAPSRQRKFL